MKTVREVSKLTGISVRTLHYYDEIKLLKPTKYNNAGYRLYDDKAIETLQQILFFKEFEIPLKDIRSIIENPFFDKEKVLKQQQKLLSVKRDWLDGLMRLIDDILKGADTLSFSEFSKEQIEEMFQAMIANMKEEQIELISKEYGNLEHYKEFFLQSAGTDHVQQNYKKMVEWYGGKEQVMEVVKNPNSQEIMKSYQDRLSELYQKLARNQQKDTKSFEIKSIVGEYEFVSKQLFQMKDVEILLLGLAESYLSNTDVSRAMEEQYGEGVSVYIGQAIKDYYQKT